MNPGAVRFGARKRSVIARALRIETRSELVLAQRLDVGGVAQARVGSTTHDVDHARGAYADSACGLSVRVPELQLRSQDFMCFTHEQSLSRHPSLQRGWRCPDWSAGARAAPCRR